jgi:hypothetical protein
MRSLLRLNLAGPKVQPDSDHDNARRHFLAYETRANQLLEIADAMLDLFCQQIDEELSGAFFADPHRAHFLESRERQLTRAQGSLKTSLQDMLTDSRSVYRVREDSRGLERRSSAMAAAAATQAARIAAGSPAAGSAAWHLSAAWDAAHALQPDPGKAYSEAIKAVEAAAHAVIEPANSEATLGTMIAAIYADPTRFRLAISRARVRTLVAMMSLLWAGQTSRHGAKTVTRLETQEAAEMAVQLAVTLVEWFASGKVEVRRRSAKE